MSQENIHFWSWLNITKHDWFLPVLEGDKHVHDSAASKLLRQNFKFPNCLNWKGNFPPLDMLEYFAGTTIAIGTNKHIDTGCGHSYAVQLVGKKFWRFWPYEGVTTVHTPDGRSYSPKKMKTLLAPGEAVIFACGWWHDTVVFQAPALSLSVYWSHEDSEFDSIHYNKVVQDVLLGTKDFCHCEALWRKNASPSVTQIISQVICYVDRSIWGGGAVDYIVFDAFKHTNGYILKRLSLVLMFYVAILIYFLWKKQYSLCSKLYMYLVLLFFVADFVLLFGFLEPPNSDNG